MKFLATEFNERAPRLSPNGKWLAYVSNQAGEDRIQVTAFPDRSQMFPVSTGPGTEAVWSRDGRELFYRTGNQLWVVEVDPYSFGTPYYDVSLDGQQFLMVRPGAGPGASFVVVENWFEELKERVPVP